MADRTLPPVGFRFEVKFYYSDTKGLFIDQNGPDATFMEIGGLGVEFESETVEDGANARHVQQLPKKPVFPNLVLKRGLLIHSEIFDWFNSMLIGSTVEVIPLDVEVNLTNEEGNTLMSFLFAKAWPKKWSISDFNANESSIVMETVELTYQYFQIIKNPI